MGNGIHIRRNIGIARRRHGSPLSHELSDQDRIGLVVIDVIVVGRSSVEIEGHEIPLRIERAAHLERERRPLGIPRRLLIAHPLHANRPANFLGEIGGFETCIVGRGSAVGLRPIHPFNAYSIARHAEEFRDAASQAVRLHVVRINRHLTIRRIGHRMGRTEGRVALERHFVFGLDHLCRAAERRVGISNHGGAPCRCGRCAANEVEQVVG